MPAPDPSCPKPLRADAQRNREAILRAAKQVLAREGIDAQMDVIARRAKVGVGTLYRHFPTKEALVRALVRARVEEIASNIELGLTYEDAWEGLVFSMTRGAEQAARDRGVQLAFVSSKWDLPEMVHARDRIHAAGDELVQKAVEQGRARPGLRGEDIGRVMTGVMLAMQQAPPDDEGWRRHLRIVIDGLRAQPGVDPLPE